MKSLLHNRPRDVFELFDCLAEKNRQQNTQNKNCTNYSFPSMPLSKEHRKFLLAQIKKLKRKTFFSYPHVIRGKKLAAKYNAGVRTHSARSFIIEMPDGREFFVLVRSKSYPLHFHLDNFIKNMEGCKLRKPAPALWHEVFKQRALIPTVELNDPHAVVMDYVPGINAFDLIVNRRYLNNFRESYINQEESKEDNFMLVLVELLAEKLKILHTNEICWGETILQNAMIDSNGNVHFCSPELDYLPSIGIEEKKVLQLQDLLFSLSAGVYNGSTEYDKKFRITNTGIPYHKTIARALKKYQENNPDSKKTISILSKINRENLSLKKYLAFPHTMARLGVSGIKQFQDIRKEMAHAEGK